MAVLAADGRGRAAESNGGDPAERHLATSRRPYLVPLHVGDRVALLLRQAHVDAHVLAAPLDAKGFVAEERRTHLPGQVVEGESQRAGLREQVELYLAEPLVLVGLNVVHAFELPQPRLHRVCDDGEPRRIRVGHLDVDRVAEAQNVGRDCERLRSRQGTQCAAPLPLEFDRRNVAPIRCHELEFHGCDRGPRTGTGRTGVSAGSAAPRILADRHVHALEKIVHLFARFGSELPERLVARALHHRGHVRRALDGSALGHLQGRGHQVSLHGGHEVDADDAGRNHRDAEDDHGHACGDHDARPPRGESEAAVERPVDEAAQSLVHPHLGPLHEVDAPVRHPRRARARQVRQVVGENQQRLDQREEEHRHHDDRDLSDDLADRAGDEEERAECHHGGQHREDHRPGDATGAADRRDHALRALLALRVDVLAHHDRIVHHDPDGKDEGEERHEVDGHPEDRHHAEGADE